MSGGENKFAGSFVRFEKCKCVAQIPLMRIREKLDEYTSRRDYDGAARHLEYWRAEAEASGDLRGAFSIYNEMMGVYRKMPDREKALASAEAVLELISVLENGDTLSAGTAYVNAGTVFDAFGEPERAAQCFESARKVYEKDLPAGDERLGGLYNNMALALCDLGRYSEAADYYEKALSVMELQPRGMLERAITYLNMADLAEKTEGFEAAEEKITKYLETAEKLIAEPSLPRDGYYAFVCEKCAPSFSYYGWFQTAAELQGIADKIYGEEK